MIGKLSEIDTDCKNCWKYKRIFSENMFKICKKQYKGCCHYANSDSTSCM